MDSPLTIHHNQSSKKQMKKLLLITGSYLLMLSSFAQSEKFVAAMKKNLAAMDTSFKNPHDLLTVANNFGTFA